MTISQPVERVRCPRCEIMIPSTATVCPGCELPLTPEMLSGGWKSTTKPPAWWGVVLGSAVVIAAVAVAIYEYVEATHTFIALRFVILVVVGIAGLAVAVMSYRWLHR
jgi:hypothetical protein